MKAPHHWVSPDGVDWSCCRCEKPMLIRGKTTPFAMASCKGFTEVPGGEQPPKLKRDWIGLRVRTVRDMSTGLGTLPGGSTATVTDSFGGLRLKSDKCPQCGVSFTISKVNPRDVVILNRDMQETTNRAHMRRRRRR